MPLSDQLNMFFNNWKMRNYKFLSVQRIKETTMIECIFHNKTFKNAHTDNIYFCQGIKLLFNPKGLAHVVEALVLRFAPFKVQGSTPHGCKQFLRATSLTEKPAI